MNIKPIQLTTKNLGQLKCSLTKPLASLTRKNSVWMNSTILKHLSNKRIKALAVRVKHLHLRQENRPEAHILTKAVNLRLISFSN